MKIIDLSKPIKYNNQDPWFMRVKIKHKPHAKSRWLIRLLGLPFRLFPKNFNGWADDIITKMGVHSTTHIDAPWRYSPTCDGKPAKTIDQIPLDLCFADGLVLDMSYKTDFDPITVSDIESFLIRENLNLKEGMIVLIRTGRDKFNGTKNFPYIGTGMSAEATLWLIQQGIRVMGIDSWGWDVPLPHQIRVAKETNSNSMFWRAHLVGQNKEFWHMEQLVNLDALPYAGFKVGVFPLRIVGASAAPARVVAVFH